MRHELFEELEAFDPKWQEHYTSVRDAAGAAGVVAMWADWVNNTLAGKKYTVEVADVPDYAGAGRAHKAALDANSEMLATARNPSDYDDDDDDLDWDDMDDDDFGDAFKGDEFFTDDDE